MKKIVLFIVVLVPLASRGQVNGPLDFTPFHQYDRGKDLERNEGIDGMNRERAAWQSDAYYRQIMSTRTNPNLENHVKQAAGRAQQGITFSTDNSTVRTTATSRSPSQHHEQNRQAQRDAEHQQWLEKRRAAAEAEAQAEAERRELKRQQKYNEAYSDYLRQTSAQYAETQKKIQYRGTVGIAYMRNYPKPERMESSYTPKNTSATESDMASIISTSIDPSTGRILLTGHEVPITGQAVYLDYSYWDDIYAKLQQSDEARAKKTAELNDTRWKELTSELDGGQLAAIEYLLKENNLTHADLVATEHGDFVFQSSDGNKIFKISDNGKAIQIAKFDESNWKLVDDDIVRMIQDGTLEQYFKDPQKALLNALTKSKIKGGTLSWEDLKKLDADKLNKLMPQLKLELKLSILDNSSKINYQFYYLPPQNKMVNAVGNLFGITTVNPVMGANIEGEGGGKIEANGKLNVSPFASGSRVGAGANFTASTAEGNAKGTVGAVIKVGDKYYMTSINASVGGGIGAKYERKIGSDNKVTTPICPICPVYGSFGVGSVIFKDIRPSE